MQNIKLVSAFLLDDNLSICYIVLKLKGGDGAADRKEIAMIRMFLFVASVALLAAGPLTTKLTIKGPASSALQGVAFVQLASDR